MNDKECLVCKVDLFNLEQQIYSVTPEGQKKIASVPLDRVAETLGSLLFMHKSNKIHLFGNEHYLESIVEAIKTSYNYGNDNIEIEVN